LSEEFSYISSQLPSVRNHLLAWLPADVMQQLLPKLRNVDLALRQVLYNPDEPIEAVYFVTSGMISLIANLEDGMQAEVGIIGREGMLGVSLLSGIEPSYVEAMVQLPGTALRMGAGDFRHEFSANSAFRTALLRYSDALNTQIIQTAACNGRHGLEQRLARWLLMAHDRASNDELPLTQDFMAMMLGVHRPSITVTAGILQRAGLIRYSSGRVTVLDRTSLEEASCECYQAVRKRFVALLGAPVS
jgi:CRP-like cAMP-binding protein